MTTEQVIPDEQLCVADFHASEYEAVLEGESGEDCPAMSQRLRTAAIAADAGCQPRRYAMLKLLADATSMMLTPEDRANPFRPLAQIGDRRSAIPTDFSDHDIALFADVAAVITNSKLRARLADLIWLRERRRGIAFALMAIDAYREASVDANTWFTGGRACWTRALQLALSIGVGAGTRIGDIEASLICAVFATQDEGVVPIQVAQILLDNRLGNARRADIAAHMESQAVAHTAAGLYHESIAYFEAAGKWHARSGAGTKSVEMVVGVANSWEAQGDTRGAGLAALHFYENAIKNFRAVPGPSRTQYALDARIDVLHGKVRAAGQAAVGQMQTVQTGRVDITELAERATAMVRGKEPLAALQAFSHVYRGARVATIRANAERNLNVSIFHQISGSTVISAQGNTIARQPAVGNGADEAETALHAQMVREYQILFGLVAKAEIEPALTAMRMEHLFTVGDFEELCHSSPFVPPKRVELVAQGLYAGYCGDMVQAMHLLVPQIENIVRVHLQHGGAITTTTSQDGIVMENGMSTLVKLPQMAATFGEDLTFEMIALFCDQNGPNLRNEVAHGLISKSACESDAGIYAWWFIFSLMFKIFWQEQQRARQADGATSNDAENAVPEK